MNVIFFKGWIKSSAVLNITDWFAQWIKVARQAENENHELVVFKIPKDKLGKADAGSINEIEKLLQDKFLKQT